ncbi:unnamed protein product, partial [Rotaria sp. Silwood1]
MLDYLNIKQINGLKIETIIRLSRFVVQYNYFCYNGQYYHQVRGGAIGSPLTLIIANCYMFFFEQDIVIIGLVVGIPVGIVVGRQKSTSLTVEKQAYQILEKNPLIDGHNDLPWRVRENFQNNINNLDLYNMTQYNVSNTTPSHTDFWSIYTDCEHQGKDATISFLEQIDVMNRIIAKYPDVFQMATTAEEVRQAFSTK